MEKQDQVALELADDFHIFDARRFTFVPKRFGACTSESAELVTHVLLPSGSPELVGLYHNRSPQPLRGISVECLFARFAYGRAYPLFPVGSRICRTPVDKAKGSAGALI
ncbi:hypothetical protein QBC46DRAFT_346059 [Diplogelasinospora grovesii]|uniref:Uncharacterized protein n=1 Tax=Diplogelasinospora grovesii TaxID=303347 RepID=A0AAN6S147_9PEZI|nr:hypothetical protein QBC46DRAFT_346059 [Diplogelasinospora grovesii]